MRKKSIKNNINSINKYYFIIGSICIMAIVLLLIYSINQNTKQYLVQRGTIEYTEILPAYIIKDEITITKDTAKVLVPVVSEGARVSKNDIIATYKGEEYRNYEYTLRDMDNEILERMQDLPVVYSSEVDTIEDTIYMLVKECIGENSYNRMKEYKQKINNSINKRANIIGELSPDGAEIKELIEKRNKYEAEAKKSNDNLLAPMPGIVSYTTDGMENKLSYSDIVNINYTTIKEQIDNNQSTDNSQIKIVNNYEAYIIMKSSVENQEYMGEGYNYRLRLIEQDNHELIAKLDKVKQVQDGIEVYFKITNGIEHIVDIRETEIEVVWDHNQGLMVPRRALNKYEDKEVYYITAIKNAEYKNIPVDVKISNDNYAVVKNYTDEELAELGLECKYEIKLYDRIIVEANK